MLQFYSAYGVISPPAMVGVFTGLLMNSFHTNIIKPMSEKIIPSHTLDTHTHIKRNISSEDSCDTEINNTIYNINIDENADKLRWQTFLKDLFLWIMTLFVFYIVFKFLLKIDIQKPSTTLP